MSIAFRNGAIATLSVTVPGVFYDVQITEERKSIFYAMIHGESQRHALQAKRGWSCGNMRSK